MKYHRLRIGWSAVWGVLAVLLLVLWVRSYSWCDIAGFEANSSLKSPLGAESIQGRIEAAYIPRTPVTLGEWKIHSYGITGGNIDNRGSALVAFGAGYIGGG